MSRYLGRKADAVLTANPLLLHGAEDPLRVMARIFRAVDAYYPDLSEIYKSKIGLQLVRRLNIEV